MPNPKPKQNSTMLGAAGEHYVMCQLLRRQMIAALTPAGVPDADIIVSNRLGDRLSAVQVKARRDIGSDGGFRKGADRPTPVLGHPKQGRPPKCSRPATPSGSPSPGRRETTRTTI